WRSRLADTECALLSDTEVDKDPAEQIVRAEFAGDLRQRLLTLAKLFRHQLAGGLGQELPSRLLQMPIGARERVEMTAAGRDRARVCALKTHALFEMLAQQVDALARG